MNVGSLFSGIGGFDLGLERAGFRTSWFCEQDDYCRRVLNRHWPGVPVYPDVTTLTAGEVSPVDVLVGGFPCQDLSLAGKGAGLEGARSGLWSEYARLIGELRPRYVIVENVTALLGRGLGRVLGDLAALGFDAEWDCIPASALGAPHRRDRIWLVAYPSGEGLEGHGGTFGNEAEVSDPRRSREGRADLGHPEGVGRDEEPFEGPRWHQESSGTAGGSDSGLGGGGWLCEPGVPRVVDGVPYRVDRTRALGNALVPQIAEWIGERIMTFEQAQTNTGAVSAPKKEEA